MTTRSGPVRHIAVLGGGTAGWLSATYLSNIFGSKTTQQLRITLVESEDIGTVGVGEATIPSLRTTLRQIGADERDFLVACNCSFKLGIKFVDWHHPPGTGANNSFMNPFGILPFANDVEAASYWLKRRREGNLAPFKEDFTESFAVHPALCDAFKAPKGPNTPNYDRVAAYAYHMDAKLFGRFLRDMAIERGVERIVDRVVEVVQDDEGYIERLKLESGQEIEADLYLDCSGFRSLLLDKTMGEPFHSFRESLLCDRAVAISKPWPAAPTKLPPYTQATAMKAGWTWSIPLYTRFAHGYVYSSNHTTPEEAERELRQFMGDEEGANPALHIKMRTGRHERLWVKNCIAMGLAGGFIEPLESTGIYIVEAGLRELSHYFPDRSCDPGLQERYNAHMARVYDSTRDFIVYHYCMTAREDTAFWRDNKYGLKRSEELERNLALWRHKVPTHLDFQPEVFSINHYTFLMAGHDAWPEGDWPKAQLIDDEAGLYAFQQIGKLRDKLLRELPDHYELLSALHAGQRFGTPTSAPAAALRKAS